MESGMFTNGSTGDMRSEYIVGLKASKLMASMGGGLAHENRPPYYAVYYIMRIS